MSEPITFKKALDNKIITIEDIIFKLKIKDALNDGGTTIYRDTSNIEMAGGNLTIIKCNTLGGNKYIYW